MALVWANGVWDTSTTTGTGTYTVSGTAVVGRQGFGTGVGNSNSCYYRAEDDINGGWENGIGTYTASGTTLSRDTILSSSNSNAAVSWPSGTRQIFLAGPAEVAPATVFNVKGFGAKGNTTAYVATTSITSGAATLTVTAGTFAAGDVGKTIIVPGAGAAGADLKTTISAVGSTTSITLAANASTTLTSASKTLTYGTDDTTAVNAAIAALVAAGRGVLYFPACAYLVTATLTDLSVPFEVRGDGPGSYLASGTFPYLSQILYTAGATSLFTASALRGDFSGLALVKTVGSAPTAGAAITVNGANSNQCVNFSDLYVRGFYIDVDVQVGAQWVMDRCVLYAPVLYGLKVQNTVDADAGDWCVSDSYVYSDTYAATAGIAVLSSGGGKLVNVKINSGDNTNQFTNSLLVAVPTATATSDLSVVGCSFENMSGAPVSVTTAAATSTWGNMSFVGIQTLQTSTTQPAINVACTTLGDVTGLSVVGGIFKCATANTHAVVELSKVTNGRVVGLTQINFGGDVTGSGNSNIQLAGTGETGWTVVSSFSNSWAQAGGSETVVAYRKLSSGVVEVKGSVISGTLTAAAFTLPAGYRPAEVRRFAVTSNGAFGNVIVNTSGTVVPNVGSNSQFQFDGIHFYAEA